MMFSVTIIEGIEEERTAVKDVGIKLRKGHKLTLDEL